MNSALANRIGKIFVDYTVGPRGILCVPASSSEQWNAEAARIWDKLQSQLVLGPVGMFGWGNAQATIAWRWFFDGEIFLLLTARETNGLPAVQLIETQRVTQPSQATAAVLRRTVDGVEYDEQTGDVISYHVLQPNGRTVQVPAENMIHVFDPAHADQYRGIPMLAPALDDLHRLRDLEHYEMLAQIDSAEKSLIFKLSSGEFEQEDMRRSMLGLVDPPEDEANARERLTNYSRALGGRAVAILPNEDVTVVKPERPTEQQRSFWDYLINKVCISVGVPRQLVAPYSVQGTVARADLGAARNNLIAMADIMVTVVRRVYEYAMQAYVQSRPELVRILPDDWLAVSLRPPKQIDVDLGRSTAAMIEELKHGATHWDAIYGAQGLDWREELRKRADQIAYMVQLARERGIDPSWMAAMMAERQAADNPGNNQDEMEVDDG